MCALVAHGRARLRADASGRRRQLVFPKGLDLDRPKRSRTSFSGEQLRQLERSYRASPYLVDGERRRLADSLGLSETQVSPPAGGLSETQVSPPAGDLSETQVSPPAGDLSETQTDRLPFLPHVQYKWA
ncbi:Ventral anterior homeobox 1b [Amphibalanus amphitrite]|uniref:Ventral anterior homeobox 1b n=1 Tax=Amphibalanus amphitrite TaxID=1232801 RepID=A0A6A4WHM4_AMPAM|nr:Ventral anterior homeobox 1b [Amphibalanus amphitrite]